MEREESPRETRPLPGTMPAIVMAAGLRGRPGHCPGSSDRQAVAAAPGKGQSGRNGDRWKGEAFVPPFLWG